MKAKGALAVAVPEIERDQQEESSPRQVQESASVRDTMSLLLAGIFSLLVVCFLYAAREIVVPLIVAFILNLLLQPVMKVSLACICRSRWRRCLRSACF